MPFDIELMNQYGVIGAIVIFLFKSVADSYQFKSNIERCDISNSEVISKLNTHSQEELKILNQMIINQEKITKLCKENSENAQIMRGLTEAINNLNQTQLKSQSFFEKLEYIVEKQTDKIEKIHEKMGNTI